MKPKLTKEAAELLKEEYKDLRQGDLSVLRTTQKSSYRITVRQLESLIRLSEAIARAHLDKTISKIYVSEAARLLRKSIIPVEQADVKLELYRYNVADEKENNEQNDVNMDDDQNKHTTNNGNGNQMEVEIEKENMDIENNEDPNLKKEAEENNQNKDINIEKVKQTNSLKVKGDEYEDIKSIIIYYVKDCEKDGKIFIFFKFQLTITIMYFR